MAAYSQTNIFPSTGNVGIGTTSPMFPFHVNGQSRFQGVATFGDSYDDILYGKGLQIVRMQDQGDNAFHISFIRAGTWVAGMGFLRNSSTFAIQNGSSNAATTGVFLSETGKVGINASDPAYELDINGNARIRGNILYVSQFGALYSDINNIAFFGDGGYIFANKNNSVTRAILEPAGTLRLYNSGSEFAKFNGTGDSFIRGNLAIGTDNSKGYKLAVAGSVIAESVKVKLQAAWPDYVFSETHTPLRLSEVETFIKDNGRLPEIPSATDIKKDGIELGDMNALLLKKIEELTLYLIEKDKQVEALKKDYSSLKERLGSLEQQLVDK
ncbi:hypothetical protein DDR33_24580 [Pararcticibacter amylolyticus]|uniref:BZIP transcription factor n=2 Tax=Pararcticibacter amylolyticus TaxID=2173175 RepID=A0A2U2P9E3_9SPHI|nr:hypothetical protein DDR33_24580 [Pararcticibacter amylolyticus]